MEFLQHSDAVQALLHVLFPREAPRPTAEGDIDWEDGEPHREREPEVAAH